jgi:dTDP-4-amino-4,6-dideoxygalactose transaminase
MHNAIPVFADIEDRTFGLDPASVASRITPRTRAILTVNLFGHPSRLNELSALAEKHSLTLIEDNAQSPGAKYGRTLSGTVGKVGILSLNYHKTIQTGEGGIALTDDPDVALRLQLTRNHGEAVVGDIGRQDEPSQLGWNYRLTEIQAAIGVPQLAKLDRFNQDRQRLAAALTAGLKEFDFLTPPVVEKDCSHVYYLFPMRFDAQKAGLTRSLFAKALAAEGIAIAEGYTKPLYFLPMYQKRRAYGVNGFPFTLLGDAAPDYRPGLCPVAERLFEKEILTTDICKYPNSEREVEEFILAVGKVIRHRERLLAL